MIEFQQAKDGTRIFTWQGKFICSGYRPWDEARKWLDKNLSRIDSQPSVVVLGLANGFHVSELSSRFPGKRILVINNQEDFVVPVSDVLGLQVSHFDILTVKSIETLKKNSKIKKLFDDSFSVVDFAPAVNLSPKFYRDVKQLLLGRTSESLAFYLSCRSDGWSAVDSGPLSETSTNAGVRLISFKDLYQVADESNQEVKARCLMGALRELLV